MRFMFVAKATTDSEAGAMPPAKLISTLTEFHEQLMRAGVLLDASALQPSSKGWRVDFDGSKRVITDGPFAESKELIAGYTLIQVSTREEAMEWTRRFPNPAIDGGVGSIEVRQVFEAEDFAPNKDAVHFHEMRIGGNAD